jgi:hypothetical protein
VTFHISTLTVLELVLVFIVGIAAIWVAVSQTVASWRKLRQKKSP